MCKEVKGNIMRYQIKNGTVSLKGETILDHIDFEIRGNEKIALVGKNGAGKTTLLRLIAGELPLDRNDKRFDAGIFLARNTTIGMLRQNVAQEEKERTVEELLLALCPSDDLYSRERYDFEQEYDRIFTAFGFTRADKNKKLGEFSGGEQTKIAMIRLLLSRPDILLLDEPTNHLDVETVEWLEDYIRNYEKAAVIVSHDRYFLDAVAGTVYELEKGGLTRYAGNYSAYRKQREKNRQIQMKKYLAQQEEIKRLTELIGRFKHKPKKAAMARSKKKVLERMERVERPSGENVHIFTEAITPRIPGSKWVLDAEKLRIGYHRQAGNVPEITLRVRRGQKIGIIGANGTGKTTFLKTILGQIPPLSGKVQLGNNIEAGYFDQHSGQLHSEKRVLEHFHDCQPSLTLKEAKTLLGHYLFRGEDTGKKVNELSGGEKSRLVLAEILESRPNLLVLDEPTNHMDIPAKETLESAFRSYTGTILFISHDRYFIKEVADALLIFSEDGVTWYPFGYEHYVEHLRKKKEYGWAGAEAVAVENTRLIEGLKEVPEKTRMQSARFSTEQSYADWQLTLAGEQLKKTQRAIEQFLDKTAESLPFDEKLPGCRESISGAPEQTTDMETLPDCGTAIEMPIQHTNAMNILIARTQAHCRWQEEYETLQQRYTEACLLWYEKWQEYEEAFAGYAED